MLLGPVGFLKLVLSLFGTISIVEEGPSYGGCLNIALTLPCVWTPVSFKLGMMIDTPKVYTSISV